MQTDMLTPMATEIHALLDQPDRRVPNCYVTVTATRSAQGMSYLARFYQRSATGLLSPLQLIGSDLDDWLMAAVPNPRVNTSGRFELIEHTGIIRRDSAIYKRHAEKHVGPLWEPYHTLHHERIFQAVKTQAERDIRGCLGLDKMIIKERSWGAQIPEYLPLVQRLTLDAKSSRIRLEHEQSYSVITLHKTVWNTWYTQEEEVIVPSYSTALSPVLRWTTDEQGVRHLPTLQSMSTEELLGIMMLSALSKAERERIPYRYHQFDLILEQVHTPLLIMMHIHKLLASPAFAKLEALANNQEAG